MKILAILSALLLTLMPLLLLAAICTSLNLYEEEQLKLQSLELLNKDNILKDVIHIADELKVINNSIIAYNFKEPICVPEYIFYNIQDSLKNNNLTIIANYIITCMKLENNLKYNIKLYKNYEPLVKRWYHLNNVLL